jgi:hypothetical protein
MLARVVQGRTSQFIRNAQAQDAPKLTRRRGNLHFPHPLPYATPPASSVDDQIKEEAAVIAAAFDFPLSLAAPGIALYINHYTVEPNGDYWVLGEATVNLYDDTYAKNPKAPYLRITLNGLAFAANFSDNTWAGTVAHEIMHNLGWGHPDGSYQVRMAIVNYDHCIRTDAQQELIAEEIDDNKLIR